MVEDLVQHISNHGLYLSCFDISNAWMSDYIPNFNDVIEKLQIILTDEYPRSVMLYTQYIKEKEIYPLKPLSFVGKPNYPDEDNYFSYGFVELDKKMFESSHWKNEKQNAEKKRMEDDVIKYKMRKSTSSNFQPNNKFHTWFLSNELTEYMVNFIVLGFDTINCLRYVDSYYLNILIDNDHDKEKFLKNRLSLVT